MKSKSTKDLRYYLDKLRRNPMYAIQGGLYMLGIKIIPFYLYEEGLHTISNIGYHALHDGIEILSLYPDDMGTITAMPGRDVPEAALQQRLAAGNLCLGAFQKNQLVAFTWCNLNETTFPGHRFKLKSDEAYLFDAYTLPSHRGGGLAPIVRYQAYKALATHGRTRLYSICERLNWPAIRFKQKLNAKIIASGIYVELLSRCSRTICLRKLTP